MSFELDEDGDVIAVKALKSRITNRRRGAVSKAGRGQMLALTTQFAALIKLTIVCYMVSFGTGVNKPSHKSHRTNDGNHAIPSNANASCN
jgi:hypothetical protein